MAIDTASLKAELKRIFDDTNPDKTTKDAADAIADALETWIKTATVQVTATSGSIVVAGSATTQANADPIQISGSPSASTGGIS